VKKLLYGAKWTDVSAKHAPDSQGKNDGNQEKEQVPVIPLKKDILNAADWTEASPEVEADQPNGQEENPLAVTISSKNEDSQCKNRESANDGDLEQLVMDEIAGRRSGVGLDSLKFPYRLAIAKGTWLVKALRESCNRNRSNQDESCQQSKQPSV